MKVLNADLSEILMGYSLVAKWLTSSLYEIRYIINPATAPNKPPITRKNL